ncbi:MAG TPA: NAD(P)-dependent oxidoreductase [Terriglobales bacterium]|nr:NAD(P)-dependent oxidoreductase [Terriglobales bacterium]
MKVALIGLGNMGRPMAQNLLRAGHQLTVYNRTRSRADGLAGATIAASASDAARAADVLLTIVADDAALQQVLYQGGALHALPPGALHVSQSTISVELSRRLAQEHAARGQRYVAAPVLGRPEAAAAAKLFVLAAGDAVDISRCEPIFSAIGQRTFRIAAEPAQANVVKLGLNFLVMAMLESLGEVFALVRKHGIPAAQFLEIATGTAFDLPIYKNYGGLIAGEEFLPAGFRMQLGLKDARLVLQAAEGAAAPMAIASLVRDHYLSGVARGMNELDWSAIAKVVAQDAGLK